MYSTSTRRVPERAEGIRRNFDASKHSSSNKADPISTTLPPRYLLFSGLICSMRHKRLWSPIYSALCVPSQKCPSHIIFSIFLGFICGSHRNVSHSYFRSVLFAPAERRTGDACTQRFSFELRRPMKPGDAQGTEHRVHFSWRILGFCLANGSMRPLLGRRFNGIVTQAGHHLALQQDVGGVSVWIESNLSLAINWMGSGDEKKKCFSFLKHISAVALRPQAPLVRGGANKSFALIIVRLAERKESRPNVHVCIGKRKLSLLIALSAMKKKEIGRPQSSNERDWEIQTSKRKIFAGVTIIIISCLLFSPLIANERKQFTAARPAFRLILESGSG